jgi:hypothetical protein
LPINQPSASRLQHFVPGWLRDLLLLWTLALALSAGVVAAGQRWPEPIPPDSRWLGLLVLGLPLLMGLALLSRWSLPATPLHPDRGESGD